MNLEKAFEYIYKYSRRTNLNEQEEFILSEALEYVVNTRGSTDDCLRLGGWYYERKQFDLALLYYQLALQQKLDDEDMKSACNCLGYIYYYGRVDQPDYENAFKYFSMASKAGSIQATYKVVDMYRNGYYVDKDYDKYATIIKSLYTKIKNTRNVFAPLPEIFSRLVKIYIKENNINKASELLVKAKFFQAQRLRYTDFFGDLTIMKYIILDLYSIVEFDPDLIDMFDLYYVLQSPCKILFEYNEKQYFIKAIKKDNRTYIIFNSINYEDVDDFFARAILDNEKLSTRCFDIDYVEII